jgi:NAD(P)H-hydrate epimerase
VPDTLPALKGETSTLVDADFVRRRLPERAPNSHKGTYGKALIVAGSGNYVGAPGMAAQAAYRAGAGLVTVAAPQHVISSLSVRLYEPTWLPITSETAAQTLHDTMSHYDALLLGPGWGQETATRDLLIKLLMEGWATFPSLIIDADGLNLLAQMHEWWKHLPQNTILTPHPGEMGRLTGINTVDVQNNRWTLAAAKAAEWNVVLVLKGAHTLIANPDGQVAALPFKTDALAKAGTGDVLAGIIAGLMAQGLEAFDAAVVGGYLHGLAGQLAAEQVGSTRSVLASDVIDALGQGFRVLDG